MAERLPSDADLSALFGIELSGQTGDPRCEKCRGSGVFRSRSGRIVGQCFRCKGASLAPVPPAPRVPSPNDCPKCQGSGEWRPGYQCFPCNGTGQIRAKAAITCVKIAEAFATAQARGLTSPKLRLGEFRFSLASSASQNAGAIYVKQDGGEYLGKIIRGEFAPSGACTNEITARIIEVAADPDGEARAYGLRTGKCSCCGLTLTNKLSIELGIGPICRGKYGWG